MAAVELADISAPVQVETAAVDDTGSDTFARYVWQAKMAVLSWLSCLTDGDAPLAVVCESIEDIVLVYQHRVVYAQLKTKTRGSWSDSNVCDPGGGIDSLVRTHNVLRSPPVAVEFHLWLEGPAGATKKTGDFFGDPRLASDAIRKKITQLGMKRAALSSFLGRLTIRTDRPSRSHIDAVILQYIGALWPALNHPQRVSLYRELLRKAELAQAGALERTDPSEAQGPLGISKTDSEFEGIARKLLTRALLVSLTPPVPTTTRRELLERINSGDVASALELKMAAAGANVSTITEAQALRARAEIRRLELLAGSETVRPRLDALEVSLLRMAEAHATSASLQGGASPGVSASPAEFVSAEIMRHPADLLALDQRDLFDRDPQLLYGLLCQLSDACLFWWRVE